MNEEKTCSETETTEEFLMEERIPVLKAVRLKCLDCSGFSSNEVKLCPVKKCTLYPYRFGKDPYRRKRKYTEEESEALARRFQPKP